MRDLTFRALTFNVWHGLGGQGVLRFSELEPKPRREARYARQEKRLAEGDFDVLFLQELNPVDERSARLSRALRMDECHAVDQSGVKIGGWGLPLNLKSGVAILARPELRLRGLGALTLSGAPYEVVKSSASFQLREHRIALFATMESPRFGRILLVNAHLHHGVEPSLEFDEVLAGALRDRILSEREAGRVQAVMRQADERRAAETARLLERIDRLSHGADSVLVGGDFNSTWRGTAYRAMVEAGFVDVYAAARMPSALRALDEPEHATWNSARNADNRLYSPKFLLPVPDFGRPAVLALHRMYDARTRRIDFVFARGELAQQTCAAALWATEADPRTGGFLSDHFGAQAEWARSS